MPAVTSRYEAVIGLEVHVQLNTRTKMFCRCPNEYGAAPNSRVCPVCLAYPGALPVVNGHAVELATRLALALGCTVHSRSEFARKSYFYPDLPKGYQITQHEHPLATGGRLPLSRHALEIGIQRLHLEEDAGKLTHSVFSDASETEQMDCSGVDFNRAGVPLAEIVSQPELRTPEQAADYLRSLRQLVRYTGAGDANMEEGSLRCDANVSLRPAQHDVNPTNDTNRFGTRVEVKNLNSFRNVARALAYEIERQTRCLNQGSAVRPETRGWDAVAGETWTMRDKEDLQDYRYFPEPDLPPLDLDAISLEEPYLDVVRRGLPRPPWQQRQRLVDEFGIERDTARVCTESRALADYLDRAIEVAGPANAVAVSNWMRTELLRVLKTKDATAEAVVPARHLAELVMLVQDGTITASAGKTVFEALLETPSSPAELVEQLGLVSVQDEAQVRSWVEDVVREHPAQVAEYAAGKTPLFSFFVGQVMKRSAGRADPKTVSELLRQALEASTGGVS